MTLSLNGLSPISQTEKFWFVLLFFFFEGGGGGEGGGNIKVLLFLLYVNDIFQSLSEAGSYLYADDTCFLYQQKEV